MYSSREKILKKDADTTDLDEKVAKIIYDLETKSEGKLKQQLVSLYLTGANKIQFTDANGEDSEALIVRIPYRSLPAFRKSRSQVVQALEKKFKNNAVIVAATRTIQSRFMKTHKSQQRPRSRTLTAVHDAILEDVVAPAHIVGKRTRITSSGDKQTRIFLDPLDQDKVEDKIAAFTAAYKAMTHKTVAFDFAKPTTFQKAVLDYRKSH